MPRHARGVIPLLTLDPRSRVPLYRQIVRELRAAVTGGRLEPGRRLPSTRSLARDLGVSRSTVVTAYEQLATEGYLESRVGAGTSVPADLPELPTTSEPEPALLERPEPRPPARPFRPGVPDVASFAEGAFGRRLRRVWRDEGALLLADDTVEGDPALRYEIARHLGAVRRVRATADQVLVTSGAQEGLALAFELITRPGQSVWLENPGYVGARRAIRAVGACCVPVPIDAEGLRGDEGRSRAPGAAACFVTPSHQFPTGGTLPLSRRLELLDWAEEGDGWIVEDDYDSEFRLEGRPLPALQGLDEQGRVLYVGTFSKALAPSMRLGYLIVPDALRDEAVRRKRARWGPGPVWLQRALAEFMSDGGFARHIRRTRSLYRRRLEALLGAVRRHLGNRASIRTPTGCLHAVLELPARCDARRVAEAAEECGVETIPLDWFRLEGTPDPPPDRTPALVLGFAGWSEDEIDRGIRVLARVIG